MKKKYFIKDQKFETIRYVARKELSDLMMDFGLIRLRAGQRFDWRQGEEVAILLIEGDVEFFSKEIRGEGKRYSLVDENPTVFHIPNNLDFSFVAREMSELAFISVENDMTFPPEIIQPEQVKIEHRGKGILDDSSYRIVRTAFDYYSCPKSMLVLGEVLAPQGRWSSYPPHHHPQPEIYHYRFPDKRGYGHAEVGEDVYKVRDKDTIIIPPNKDHSQVSAPGYVMWYLWVIRHLPGCPYIEPEFTQEHAWIRDLR